MIRSKLMASIRIDHVQFDLYEEPTRTLIGVFVTDLDDSNFIHFFVPDNSVSRFIINSLNFHYGKKI